MGRVVRLALIYFLAVFAAGFVLGSARALLVAPRIGAVAATLVELPMMLMISWAASRSIFGHPGNALSRVRLLTAGSIAFGLLLCAEALLSISLGQLTFAQHLALYRQPDVQLGLAGQIIFAVFPLFQGGATEKISSRGGN